MHFIVFDLEFNSEIKNLQSIFEIIQIGAVKLDADFNIIATFNRYVKPTIYNEINPYITEMTGITTEQLQIERPFPEVYEDYIEFIDGFDSIFCIWGMSDIKVLFRNIEHHKLNKRFLSRLYINIQPYVSSYFNLPKNNLLKLQNAVEALNLPIESRFHNALNDAHYTAEILKKIYNPSIKPKFYDPFYVNTKPRKPKKVIDEEKLIQQLEKMFARKMTEEEHKIIMLAYKMGRTNQFLK